MPPKVLNMFQNNDIQNPWIYPKITFLYGLFLFLLGVVLLFTKHLFIEYITASFFILSPNSLLKGLWYKTPFPILTEIYMFNWTNPEEFYDLSTKPAFQETGPYRFLHNMEKVNLIWHQNDTVSFKIFKTFHYDEEPPNGNLSDVVTTLNFITSILADIIKNENYFTIKGISFLLNTASPNIEMTKTAHEFIYGIDDFLLNAGNSLPFAFSKYPKYENTGLLGAMNFTSDFSGTFNIATGVSGHFEVQLWNYYNKIPYYKKPCGHIRGTLGEFYGRNLEKNDIVLFVPDMCRYVKFDYEKEMTVNGILGYKYSIGTSILDNGTHVEENKCFCDVECIPSGMISVSSCHFNLPAYLSLPHFNRADPAYQHAVNGLKPDSKMHDSYIVVEPVTGIPLLVSVGMQLNILVQPVEGIDIYEKVRKIYFPLTWVKMYAKIPNIYSILLQIYLHLHLILTSISIVCILTGLYLVIVTNESVRSMIHLSINGSRRAKMKKMDSIVPEESPLVSNVKVE